MIAKKMKYSREQLILEDPNSDKTMSDRAFYGAGQYYLTPLRISGVDEDHDFFYPHKSKQFLSDEHRDAFRYTNMPSHKDLLRMIKQMYPRKVKDSSTLLEWRDKILQIDFAALETLLPRENFFPFGATLYIDVKTRMPMGIWISGRKRLFLPNEGRDWEHAKVSGTQTMKYTTLEMANMSDSLEFLLIFYTVFLEGLRARSRNRTPCCRESFWLQSFWFYSCLANAAPGSRSPHSYQTIHIGSSLCKLGGVQHVDPTTFCLDP